MIVAAIYARKSTEQSTVADEQKSVARQIEHARAYATAKGWNVDDRFVFVDDGISGAEFANRPGFVRLMNALKPRAAFQVLLMSEESRLGREAIETAYALKQIVQAGVRVFFYLEDRERTIDSPTEKFMLSVVTFADELEREKARQRTYDAMARKARAGHVTGGRVFGYDNIEIKGADGKRSHVERRINEAEAAVVRRIFDLCAAGMGYSRIAKLLNAERAPAPRPQQGRPSGWAPSSIHALLRRPLYRGEIVWNTSRKRNRWGQHDQQPRPPEDWLRKEVAGLRIVSDELWQAAHQRLGGIRAQLEKTTGRAFGGRNGVRRRGNDSPYLLSGFARCAVCGGGIGVTSRSHGRERAYFYACTAYHKRGTTVCGNALAMRIERLDEAVLDTLGGKVLHPAIVMAILDGVLQGLNPKTAKHDIEGLRGELTSVEREIMSLTNAIAAGGEMRSLLDGLKSRERERDQLLAALAARESFDMRRLDRAAVEVKVREYVNNWRALLTRRVDDGRQLLREALTDPLKFTPQGQTYRFEGEVGFEKLIAGVVGLPTVLASPTGLVAL